MDDIVAVEITTDNGSRCYFLTWGRIQARVDPTPLERLVLSHATRFATPGAPVSARLCATLQEAAGEPYFYEGFFGFCAKGIPFGRRYKRWRKRMADEMQAGRQIFFLGNAVSLDGSPSRGQGESP